MEFAYKFNKLINLDLFNTCYPNFSAFLTCGLVIMRSEGVSVELGRLLLSSGLSGQDAAGISADGASNVDREQVI
jgi:hypothetical protein